MPQSSHLSKLGVICAGSLAAAVASWLLLVPGVVSGGTFAWLSAAVLLVVGVSLKTAVNARPTRSIAHVLHDVEQPPLRRP